ncbi:hypothetical protein PFLUV_G00054460 [Perca fluviatilis]|uniref:Uncharacterized protein n=1 Tax=Perca fluviatilis TaxID=8168 RepID=A0A6A5FGE7_PERFL|nr:hypothetical protein PFLUV_G00054460 [Perca fluviatilis]
MHHQSHCLRRACCQDLCGELRQEVVQTVRSTPESSSQLVQQPPQHLHLRRTTRGQRRRLLAGDSLTAAGSVIIQNDQVVEFKGLRDEEEAALAKAIKEYRKAAATVPKHAFYSSSLDEDSEDEVICLRQGAVNPLRLKFHHNHRLGFPNESVTCYMNASLHSLITQREFITDIYSHDMHLWNYIYEETELIRYLIIHLKRFRFSPSLEVEKLHDPVVLQPFRELMVTTSQADGWYKLISVISHLGYDWNSVLAALSLKDWKAVGKLCASLKRNCTL